MKLDCGCGIIVCLGELFLIHQCLSVSSGMSVTLSRSLLKAGFHRDLHTKLMVQFVSLRKDDCKLLLVESIPAGCYVDIYQINQLKDFGGPRVWTGEVIDLEKPEYLSTNHLVHVYPEMREDGDYSVSNITLPVHLRYHRPGVSQLQVVKVEIPHPQLYYTCTQQSATGLTIGSDAELTAPCNTQASSRCTWFRVQYSALTTEDDIVAFVPIGDPSHQPVVVMVTIMVTGVGGLWLAVAVWRKSYEGTADDM